MLVAISVLLAIAIRAQQSEIFCYEVPGIAIDVIEPKVQRLSHPFADAANRAAIWQAFAQKQP
jgi:hypothetical protein